MAPSSPAARPRGRQWNVGIKADTLSITSHTHTQMWVTAVAQLKCQHVPYCINFSDQQQPSAMLQVCSNINNLCECLPLATLIHTDDNTSMNMLHQRKTDMKRSSKTVLFWGKNLELCLNTVYVDMIKIWPVNVTRLTMIIIINMERLEKKEIEQVIEL